MLSEEHFDTYVRGVIGIKCAGRYNSGGNKMGEVP
jgi:hypothetical protein